MKKAKRSRRSSEAKKKKRLIKLKKRYKAERKLERHCARRLLGAQDDINTDYVISGRYKFRIQDPKELAKHIFEDTDPTFIKRLKKGDCLIAGANFGCGSSREQAPVAIKAAGIKAVVAKSFARIFYRNAFNIGLTLVECGTKHIDDGDEIELDLDRAKVKNVSKGLIFDATPLPPIIKRLLEDGGVVQHFKKHGGFDFGEA